MRFMTGLFMLALAFAASVSYAQDGVTAADEQAARATLQKFIDKDSGVQAFIDESVGYAVFPSVGKAGFIIGGAHGKGVVFEDGIVIGAASITEAKLGLVAGLESFSQLVVFQTDDALNKLKEGKFDMGAQASAVAAKAGAAATTSFSNGVAVFITDQGGLMGDASVGAQKFSFTPNPM